MVKKPISRERTIIFGKAAPRKLFLQIFSGFLSKDTSRKKVKKRNSMVHIAR